MIEWPFIIHGAEHLYKEGKKKSLQQKKPKS